MSTNLDLSALDRLTARLRKIANPDARNLMDAWELIIKEDNRKGVLAGTDHNGGLMLAVTYRPTSKPLKLTAAQKGNPAKGARRGLFAGFGPQAAGLHNNLTSAEYRRLGGPPLAPRGAFSRVITNLQTNHRKISEYNWEAVGHWDQVVDVKGRPFLHYHFTGAGRQLVRDLRGVRPDGIKKAKSAARAWMIEQIRTYGS